MRRVPSKHRNAPIARERDRDAVKRLSLLLAGALILAGGFVYGGVQHFAALRLGYETEKLRNALTDAKEEQRRLIVQKEIAASPARLERAARQLGMQAMEASQLDPLVRPRVAAEPKISSGLQPAIKTPPTQKIQRPRGN
jgi:cell division protein FtsL